MWKFQIRNWSFDSDSLSENKDFWLADENEVSDWLKLTQLLAAVPVNASWRLFCENESGQTSIRSWLVVVSAAMTWRLGVSRFTEKIFAPKIFSSKVLPCRYWHSIQKLNQEGSRIEHRTQPEIKINTGFWLANKIGFGFVEKITSTSTVSPTRLVVVFSSPVDGSTTVIFKSLTMASCALTAARSSSAVGVASCTVRLLQNQKLCPGFWLVKI